MLLGFITLILVMVYIDLGCFWLSPVRFEPQCLK